jgi:serine/threonine protein kinase
VGLGVLHRDIKGANILTSKDGQVRALFVYMYVFK